MASETNLAWFRGLDGNLTAPGLGISNVDQRRRGISLFYFRLWECSAMDEHPKSSVSIEQLGGQWAVQILEAGAVTKRLFEREEFARNYAASQW